MEFAAKKIEQLKTADLVPYARNARTHSEAQVAQIAGSIREYGFTNPVLIDGNNGIVAGHGRVLAAQKLGIEQVPCIRLAHLTDAQRRAYVLADNRLALNAGWDAEILAVELDELKDAGVDLASLGFDKDELNELIGTPNTGPLPDPPIPPVPVTPKTVRGDIWLLGDHRLMCGDCRVDEDVAALLSGKIINLAFTSPPYAAQREYDESSGFKPIDPDDYVEWFAPVADNIKRRIANDGSWFVNIKPPGAGLDTHLYVFDLVIAHVRKWGWHFATEFCWERNGVPKAVTQRFKNQFEPIYQFALDRWKMRPESVRHKSANVPMSGGPGVGATTWSKTQGGNGPMFGADKKNSGSMAANQGIPGGPNVSKKPRRNGTSQSSFAATAQGTNAAPGEYIGEGLAFPGNRLPTFTSTHQAVGHAAAFPVGLPDFFIRAYTDEKDVVYEPFSGSGSTLIATENNSRHGFGMEISPQYVDVSIIRWQNHTGKKAIHAVTGEEFNART